MTAQEPWPSSPLINADELATLISDGSALVFDCRFNLMHTALGRNSWLSAHIPGAVYADLDQNLSGRVTRLSGRHPLPQARSFAAFLGRSGWRSDCKVVAYDAHGGAFAARLWWLMSYFGLGRTAVLDGGINAWMSAGNSLEHGAFQPSRQPSPELKPEASMALSSKAIESAVENGSLENGEAVLIDARSNARFEGLEEPIDAIAGHIRGAINLPMEQNLNKEGRFKSPAELQSRFKRVLARTGPDQAIHMCGSGVTACHNLLAMEYAGLNGSRLFADSWSGWISDPARPTVKGKR